MGGVYKLVVTDQLNGCSSEAEVRVEMDTIAPIAVANANGALSCALSDVVLDGSGSSSGMDFSYVWTTMNGQLESGFNSIQATASRHGDYQLIVTDASNGCTASAFTQIEAGYYSACIKCNARLLF